MKRKKAGPPAPSAERSLAEGQQHAERGELAQAEACYRRALAAAPDHPGALCMLGLVLVDRQQANAAVEVLEHARDIAPQFPPILLALGAAYSAAGHDALAVASMEAANALETTSTIPLERLAKHHLRAGRTREAIGFLRRVLRRDPSHAQAQFLLAGLTGERAAEFAHPPADLIAELFDGYAASFDHHLTAGLKYDVPKALVAMIAACGALPDASKCVVDLGCGTGLVGIELRAFARTLIGSDIAPQMIARSRERKIYDELHREDLATTLARVREVDLIVAADVFIYVGALEATFAACAAALRAAGMLAFSIERSDGDGVALRSTLRYVHSAAYIAGLAAAHGFAVERAEPSILRLENDQPVHGLLYVLRREARMPDPV